MINTVGFGRDKQTKCTQANVFPCGPLILSITTYHPRITDSVSFYRS